MCELRRCMRVILQSWKCQPWNTYQNLLSREVCNYVISLGRFTHSKRDVHETCWTRSPQKSKAILSVKVLFVDTQSHRSVLWMVERDARCEAQARSAGAQMCLHRLDWSFAYAAVLPQVTCRGGVYAISATAFAHERRLQLVLRDGHFGCWTGDFTPECKALLSVPSDYKP